MDNTKIFEQIHKEINFQSNITPEQIIQRAYKQIINQKNTIHKRILTYRNKEKKLILIAGSPGSGKIEVAQLIQKKYAIDIIGKNEIIQLCDGYSGSNYYLFQKAGHKGVSILLDYVFENKISFILDSNALDYDLLKSNIERAKNHNYQIEINYIYRPILLAKKYAQTREKRSGRKFSDDVFNSKSLEAIEIMQKVIGDIKVNFYDLSRNQIIEDIDINNFNEMVRNDLELLV